MGRGLLSGLWWGAIVGGLGLGVMSQLMPQPGERSELGPAAAPEASADLTPPDRPEATPAPMPGPDPVPPQAPAGDSSAPENATSEGPLSEKPVPDGPVADTPPVIAAPTEVPSAAAMPQAPLPFPSVAETAPQAPVLGADPEAPPPMVAPDAPRAVAAVDAPMPDTRPAAQPAPVPTPDATPTPAPDATAAEASKPVASAESAPVQAVSEPVATPEAPVTKPGAPSATVITVPPGSEFDRPLPETDPMIPAMDTPPQPDAVPGVVAPGVLPDLPSTDTTSAAQPTPDANVPAAPDLPPLDAKSPQVTGGADPDTLQQAVAPAPQAPAPESGPASPQLPPPPPVDTTDAALLPLAEPDVAGVTVIGDAKSATPDTTDVAAEVTAGRLPQTDVTAPSQPASAAESVAETQPVTEPTPDAAPDLSGMPAFQRYARPFENPEARPLMSIILIDTGGPDLNRVALAALPYPVTFAIDPQARDAATAASIYRDAGQEVVMLGTGLSAAMEPAEAEAVLRRGLGVLPEAIGVVDPERDGVQVNTLLTEQVVRLLRDQGRGLLTIDAGLNSAERAARREDVPAATIYRSLDAADENAPTVRRYLDRAAFEAAKDGRVVVIGHTRQETLEALAVWVIDTRAASVALAPVTAAMSGR